MVLTVPGSQRVLKMSLEKGGMDGESIARLLKAIRPSRLHPLAEAVSALWDAAPMLPKPGDTEPPKNE